MSLSCAHRAGRHAGGRALVRARLRHQRPVMAISPNSHDSIALVTETEHHRLSISQLTWCWICAGEFVFLLSPWIHQLSEGGGFFFSCLCIEASNLDYLDSVFTRGVSAAWKTHCVFLKIHKYISLCLGGVWRKKMDTAKHQLGLLFLFEG